MMFEIAVSAPSLQRHDWVYLSEAGWQKLMITLAEDALHLHAWREANWPLVVRRQDADVLHDKAVVCAGIALPPSPAMSEQKGRRISVRLALDEMSMLRAPLTLDQAIPSAPAMWQPALSKLLQSASAQSLRVQVYGSLAFQAITGLSYLKPQSDIDLLLRINSKAQLAAGVKLFAQFSEVLPVDGEIIFPNGAAVAWKEWWQVQQCEGSELSRMQTRVLVKDMTQVRLLTMVDLLECLN
jgi:phosphoribosyl-dephospho-CoA transferase